MEDEVCGLVYTRPPRRKVLNIMQQNYDKKKTVYIYEKVGDYLTRFDGIYCPSRPLNAKFLLLILAEVVRFW